LFAPSDSKLTVKTRHCELEIAAGAKVTVETNAHSTVLRNLHDGRMGSVKVRCDGRTVVLPIARQLVIGNSMTNAASDVSSSNIAVRNTINSKLSNGLNMQLSEFSILSAMMKDGTLKALIRSNSRSDRKQFDCIAKNACILGITSLSRGSYTSSNE
jgi:hypothetical protein